MNTIIYCRISSNDQSLEAQEHECIKYCQEKNLHIIDIIHEIASSYKNKQSKLKQLINENNNINIVIYSIDRFSRDPVVADQLLNKMEQNKITLLSVKEQLDLNTPIGKHQFRTHVSYSRLESEMISQRVKTNIKYKRDHDMFIGQAPYGYQVVENKKVPNPIEQHVIKFIINNYNKQLTSVEFTARLYKLLDLHQKPSDSYVSIVFDDHNGEQIAENIKVMITPEMLGDILNEYEILKRNKFWNTNKIRNVFTVSFNNVKRIRIN